SCSGPGLRASPVAALGRRVKGPLTGINEIAAPSPAEGLRDEALVQSPIGIGRIGPRASSAPANVNLQLGNAIRRVIASRCTGRSSVIAGQGRSEPGRA